MRLQLLVCVAVFANGPFFAYADHHEKASTASSSNVIRHAVCVKFKDSSTKTGIQGVVDAFAEMAKKIDVITNYDFGNLFESPYRGEFTHLFTISFADQAGLDAYNKHPAHIEDLVGVLMPQLDDLLVVDYGAEAKTDSVQGRVRHVFLISTKPDATREQILALDAAMQAVGDMDEVKEYEWGVGDKKQPLSKGYSRCYVFNFADMTGLRAYAASEQHDKMAAAMRPVMQQMLALDLNVKK